MIILTIISLQPPLLSEIPRHNSTDLLIYPHVPLRANSRNISLPRLLHQALQNSIMQGTGLNSSSGVEANNAGSTGEERTVNNNNNAASASQQEPNKETSTSSITSSSVDSDDGETASSHGSTTSGTN